MAGSLEQTAGSKPCTHTALKLLLNSANNDSILVVESSCKWYLTIEKNFFKRAQELSTNKLNNYKDVENLIKKFDPSLKGRNLDILKSLHDKSSSIFMKSITTVQSVASKYLCCMPKQLPLLIQKNDVVVHLSQFQIACILANIFFFNQPYKIDSEYENDYPYLYFRRLFVSESSTDISIKCEKLKFIFYYFDQLNKATRNGAITFRRHAIINHCDWANSSKVLTKIEFSARKMEEGVEKGYCEVDFSNEMIGGGVLDYGTGMESFRFLRSPELIISRLFTQKLLPNEAVVITGTQIFSDYEGYRRSFRFKGRHVDVTPFDGFNRRKSQIIAIDALAFSEYDKDKQFEKAFIDRELNKSLSGFQLNEETINNTIATGKWGCGIFNGNPYLKCLIQVMTAAEANRNLVIYTYGDQEFCEQLIKPYEYLCKNKITVGKLYEMALELPKEHNNIWIYIYDRLVKAAH